MHLTPNKEKDSDAKSKDLNQWVCLYVLHDLGKAQHFRPEEACSAVDQTTSYDGCPRSDHSFSCLSESTCLLNMIGHLQSINGKISVGTLQLYGTNSDHAKVGPSRIPVL